MGLFDFLQMAGDYDQRKVARYDGLEGFVSTAKVLDSRIPYETGIQFNGWGPHVRIVETYYTVEAAKIGHIAWADKMMTNGLPTREPLDVGTSEINDVLNSFRGDVAGADE